MLNPAGQAGVQADPLQPSSLDGVAEHTAAAHQREHLKRQSWAESMDLLQHPQGDQILAVAIAENEESSFIAADTIP